MRKLSVALLTLGLVSCASTEQLAARDDASCASIGIANQHPSYGECRIAAAQIRQREEALRLQRVGAILSGTGAALGGASQAQEPVPTRSPRPLTQACFKRSEVASTFNKICYYDCMGSPYAETISSTSLCPLTVNR
jgi:hypothetical protein